MRVLIVSQYYAPENVSIPVEVAESLRDHGHSVRVLTGFPNYPTGKIFPGYKQKWRHKSVDAGLEICRVPLFPDHSPRVWARILNYSSFALSSMTARRFARGADVIYVYATQMTPALGPWLWGLTGGAPYVLHVQDLWPDSINGSSLVSNGIVTRFIDRVLSPWLRVVYRRSAGVIAIAPRMARTLMERGAPESRTHVVYNWARPKTRTDPPTRVPRDGLVAVFAGNVGDMQDVETIVFAAHQVAETGLRVRIVGDGIALQRVQEIAERLDVTNVEFVGRVTPEKMGAIYAAADYSLVTLKNLPVFEGTIPSKFQSSLADGLPIISTVGGDVRELIETHGIGFTAIPEDIESLSAAFRRAVAQSEAEREEMRGRAVSLHARAFAAEPALNEIEKILIETADEREKA